MLKDLSGAGSLFGNAKDGLQLAAATSAAKRKKLNMAGRKKLEQIMVVPSDSRAHAPSALPVT